MISRAESAGPTVGQPAAARRRKIMIALVLYSRFLDSEYRIMIPAFVLRSCIMIPLFMFQVSPGLTGLRQFQGSTAFKFPRCGIDSIQPEARFLRAGGTQNKSAGPLPGDRPAPPARPAPPRPAPPRYARLCRSPPRRPARVCIDDQRPSPERQANPGGSAPQ